MAVEQPSGRRRVAPPADDAPRDDNGVPIEPKTVAQRAQVDADRSISENSEVPEDDMRPEMHPEMRQETSMDRPDRMAREIFDHEHELGDTEDKFPMPAGG